jgi:hypothetical protein
MISGLGLSTAKRDCVSPGSRLADCERKMLKRPGPTLEAFRKVGVKVLSGFGGFLVLAAMSLTPLALVESED